MSKIDGMTPKDADSVNVLADGAKDVNVLATTKSTNKGGRPAYDDTAITPELVYAFFAKGNTVADFHTRLGMSRRTFFNLLTRRPELQQAYVDGLDAGIENASSVILKLLHDVDTRDCDRIAAYKAWMQFHPRVKQLAQAQMRAELELLTDDDIRTRLSRSTTQPENAEYAQVVQAR